LTPWAKHPLTPMDKAPLESPTGQFVYGRYCLRASPVTPLPTWPSRTYDRPPPTGNGLRATRIRSVYGTTAMQPPTVYGYHVLPCDLTNTNGRVHVVLDRSTQV